MSGKAKGEDAGNISALKNAEVARIFGEMADLLEIKGENPFRIRAYRKAAQSVEGLSRDVSIIPEEELLDIPGIGKDLAGKIDEIARTGTLKAYEDLKGDVPGGLLTLLTVPGLGPKTAKLLYDKLKITSIEELERLAKGNKLSGLPGIKEKTEENILRGIDMLKRGRERQPLGKVLPVAEEILSRIRNAAPVLRIDLAGSLRRWKDTVKDIDILCASTEPEKVMEVFVRLPYVKDILARGKTKSSVVMEEGIQADLRVVEEASYGAALAYFTGSKAHNIRIREIAVKAGLKINEYGVFREKDDKKIGGANEEDVYKILGLPYIAPELREDTGEIEAAIKGRLPELIELKDIRGDLHVHSSFSDGKHTLEELASASKEKGYEYIAVTDHSKGLGIARGLSEERLMGQIKEIDALNKRMKGFRLLKGIEVDIKSDNSLDFPDEVLKKLDIVIASVHSGFKQSKERITARLVAAMKNPCVNVIAHPTGRLIGERDAYEVDMEAVFKTAKETGTALEINAYPLRLDLTDVHARRAGSMSVPVAISTDAHVEGHFDYMSYGVSVARRAWLQKNDVINCLPIKSLFKTLDKKRA